MEYKEILDSARTCIGPYCKACPVCNGKACGNQVPGPGAKAPGSGFIRNFDAWQKICVNMDTICPNEPVDTAVELFGTMYRYPFFAAPLGAMKLHYGEKYTDREYNSILVNACADSGIAAFTGDGVDAAVFQGAMEAIRTAGGVGVPTIKPWNQELVFEKLDLARTSGCKAVAMDIDGAGLPFLKNMTPPAGSKSVQELAEIIRYAGMPFIVKGVMTVRGAQKAAEAGAAAIIVSNHGGRVLGPDAGQRRGAAGDRRCRRQHEDLRRRRHPHRHGRVQGAGTRRGRRAHRPPVRADGLRRRRTGRGNLHRKDRQRAARHDGHVRRAHARRDHARLRACDVTYITARKKDPGTAVPGLFCFVQSSQIMVAK